MYVLLRKQAGYISARLHHRGGFSFIELAISLALMMAAIAPMAYFFASGINVTTETEVTTQCLILAYDLMEEITGKNFEETPGSFGREAGETTSNRSNYDDVDDYDNWGPNNEPEYINGTRMDGTGSTPYYSYLRRSVIVQNVRNTDFDTVVANGSSDFKKIQVTVNTIATYKVSVTRTLEAVVSKH